MIIERCVAARNALQAIIEIEHDLVQRQLIDDHGTRSGIGQLLLPAAAVLTELQNGAEIIVGDQDGRFDPGFVDVIDLDDFRHIGRIVHLDHRAVVHMQMIDDARRRRDEIEIEFPFEPLGDDLEMQEA